jgi:isoleucyl-tRNA synthetase
MASASRATVFSVPPDKLNFPRNEDEIQAYWDKIDAFKESLRRSEGRKLWTFYDGPPFATGLPHYGHILAGTIKDIVCRYAHQTGHHVERRAGWDCHGLPVEFEIDQKLGIKSRDDVLAMGIGNYNDECRAIVMRYSSQWVSTVTRMGRWIDFENDYKTMNISFMESVWWVFKQIFDKGLVYQGFKVMPYSTACSTPLSNFEASQNYKDVSDPALYVGFPLVGDPDGAMLVAWTTTPWTLPSNLALCVHPDFPYARVRDHASGKVLVMTTGRLAAFYSPAKLKKNGGKPLYTLLSECTGASLKGQAYEPCFDYFKTETRGFRVLVDKFVKDDSGTGIVHMAPAFGEEDNRICREAGLVAKDGAGIVCPLDANGRFTAEVRDFAGMYIKDADGPIAEALKARGLLVEKEVYNHSYPFCWRSETPLIYRTIPSWFVNVESIKERLLAANAQTYWVPEFVQTKRFHNWLKDARDWAISRNRFWGTPLPIWTSADGEEVVVVGSIAELQALSGRADVTDLHRQYIDEITIPSKQGKGLLRRVDEVFDCWFESGAMPYAQHHYPFENKAKFEAAFPADFIAEGLDQTRGWFYTLMVLSTALFDKPPFKNLIVNGLVLAEDGLKMSKRLKNYPDPLHVIHEYGADALRYARRARNAAAPRPRAPRPDARAAARAGRRAACPLTRRARCAALPWRGIASPPSRAGMQALPDQLAGGLRRDAQV